MKIISGKIKKYQKIVVYGPEGIGKSTFASQFPAPLFIDTEGSTAHLSVDRVERPSSWAMLMQYIENLKKDHQGYQTLVIDTIDWAEHQCVDYICNKNQKQGIEEFGYGKGYVYEKEEFGRLLNKLQDLVDTDMNVVLTAHCLIRKFERPDQTPYDRYELKLNKAGTQKISDLVKEWCDMLLFANYKVEVYKTDSKDAGSKKVKAIGGQRVMYTCHHLNWDAKNRHGLKEELPFDYKQIASHIPGDQYHKTEQIMQQFAHETLANVDKPPIPMGHPKPETEKKSGQADQRKQKEETAVPDDQNADLPKALADLMADNNVTEQEIRKAVAFRGYFPEDMAITDYPKDFIEGCLIAAFDQIMKVIHKMNDNKNIPF